MKIRKMSVRVAAVSAASVALAGGVLISAVSTDASGPTKSPVQFPEDGGPVDLRTVADFVPTLGRDGNRVGWTRKQDVFVTGERASTVESVEVFADDLKTVVGHMYRGRGFVPIGEDPADTPKYPVVTLGQPGTTER